MIVKQRGQNVEGTAYWLHPPNYYPQRRPFKRYARTMARARRLAEEMGSGSLLQRQTIHVCKKTGVTMKVTDCWSVNSLRQLTRNQVCSE